MRPVGRRSRSSIQPISISRSPVLGSKPVVSVSRTISRAMPLNGVFRRAMPVRPRGRVETRSVLRTVSTIRHLGPGGLDARAGVDDEIGAAAFFRVRASGARGWLRTARASCPDGQGPVRAGWAGALTTTTASMLRLRRFRTAGGCRAPPGAPPLRPRPVRPGGLRRPADGRWPPGAKAWSSWPRLRPAGPGRSPRRRRRPETPAQPPPRPRRRGIEAMHGLVGVETTGSPPLRTARPWSTCPCRSSR